jgi:hypothetical protein
MRADWRVADVDGRLPVTMGPPKFPPMGNHPIHVHPARPLYRFVATGLSASMWFFVRMLASWSRSMRSLLQLMYRAKKDGPALMGWKHPWEH